MKELHVQWEVLGTETGTIYQHHQGRKGWMPRLGTAHLACLGPKEGFAALDNFPNRNFYQKTSCRG